VPAWLNNDDDARESFSALTALHVVHGSRVKKRNNLASLSANATDHSVFTGAPRSGAFLSTRHATPAVFIFLQISFAEPRVSAPIFA
jgi:hypothetical protein